jgi:hypothetical protein
MIFCFWNTCDPTYASFCYSEQHFSLLHLTSVLLLLIVFYKTNGAAYLMEIIACLLSRAVLEGEWRGRTVWTQTILTERRWNGDRKETWLIVWICPYSPDGNSQYLKHINSNKWSMLLSFNTWGGGDSFQISVFKNPLHIGDLPTCF